MRSPNKLDLLETNKSMLDQHRLYIQDIQADKPQNKSLLPELSYVNILLEILGFLLKFRNFNGNDIIIQKVLGNSLKCI